LWLLRQAAVEAGGIPILSFSEAWTPEGSPDHDGLAAASRGISLLPQRDGDLGRRLEGTFTELFEGGHREVVVIGSDCPALPSAVVASAFETLRRGARAVLGPTSDGGYYLVGARAPLPAIFTGIPWSTDRVMEATLAALDGVSVSATILPRFDDIDVPSDLERLAAGVRPLRPEAAVRTLAFIESLRLAGRLPAAPLAGRSRSPA
jgi:rSAM/selenodomain-associated transferase 1